MDYNGILSDLIIQLVNNGREFLNISRNNLIHPIIKNRVLQQKNKSISSLLELIKSTTNKSNKLIIQLNRLKKGWKT